MVSVGREKEGREEGAKARTSSFRFVFFSRPETIFAALFFFLGK